MRQSKDGQLPRREPPNDEQNGTAVAAFVRNGSSRADHAAGAIIAAALEFWSLTRRQNGWLPTCSVVCSKTNWWKTYRLESTPLDDVRESMVPLFVAHGTRDGTILAPDLFVIEALRQRPTRSLRYVVLENGDHAFETAPGQSRIPEIFNDSLGWALDSGRTTGTAVLH
jgi:hypothetical protein